MADGKSYYVVFETANGCYYDKQGETLGKELTLSLQRQARISSPFNLNRRHPVKGRVRPHKGVDFAVSPSTPVMRPSRRWR